MTQLHKRFADEQIKALLDGYCQGLLDRSEIQELPGTGRTPRPLTVVVERHAPGRHSAAVEAEIERELLREQEIVEDECRSPAITPRLCVNGSRRTASRSRRPPASTVLEA